MFHFFFVLFSFLQVDPSVSLARDASWATSTIEPYHAGAFIRGFHVAKNHLVVFERVDFDTFPVIYKINKSAKGVTALELVTSMPAAIEGKLIGYSGSKDGFYYTKLGVPESNKLMAFRLQTMDVEEVLDLERILVFEFAPFINGDMILRSSQIYELGKDRQPFSIYQAAESYSRYSVFFASKGFRSITPLHPAPQGHVRERLTKSSLRKKVDFKSGSLGQTVGIFCHHQPGVQLYNQKGEIFTELVHPGNGVPSMNEVDENGEPLRMYLQDDIWIDDAKSHVYISDIANRLIWVMNFDNEVLASIPTEFIAIELVMDERFVYMRGRDGELMRYHKPRI